MEIEKTRVDAFSLMISLRIKLYDADRNLAAIGKGNDVSVQGVKFPKIMADI